MCAVGGVNPGSCRSVAFLQSRGLFVFPLIENTLSGVRLSGVARAGRVSLTPGEGSAGK